jgi:hypothetical protein
VHPEAWHLSYAPASAAALQTLTPALLAEAVRSSDMLGKDLVLERIEELHARYVANIDPPPAGRATAAA